MPLSPRAEVRVAVAAYEEVVTKTFIIRLYLVDFGYIDSYFRIRVDGYFRLTHGRWSQL